MRSNFLAYLAWIAVCIIWGTTYMVIKIAVNELPPLLFAGLRWITAGSLLLVILRIRGIKLPKKKELIHVLIPGILMLGIANGFVVIAEQWLPSGLTALLLTITPFVLFGMELLIPESPKFRLITLLGLICGFFGVMILFYSEMYILFHGDNLYGIICIIIVLFTWSAGTLYAKYKKTETAPLMKATMQMLAAGTGHLITGLILGEYNRFVFTTNSLLAFIYLAVIASIFGYGSYIYAVSKLPISFVSTHYYINIIIALLLGWFFLNEKLSFEIIISTVFILIGVFLIKIKTPTKKDRQSIIS